MPEGNKLQEPELAWLKHNLARFVSRASGWLKQENLGEGERDAILENHSNEVKFHRKLIEGGRVLPEDRVVLMLILLDERKRLYTNFDSEGREERGKEGSFINRFLRRLSKIDWEALGLPDTPYDPKEIWGSFRLTEAEMHCAVVMAAIESQFSEGYDRLTRGALITLTKVEEKSRNNYQIRLSRVHNAYLKFDDSTPGKIFEGVIEKTTEKDREPELNGESDEVFGFLFSNGKAFWFDSSPNSDRTDRYIRAGSHLL